MAILIAANLPILYCPLVSSTLAVLGKTVPFLSQGQTGQYLALSHRWGDPDSQGKKLVTTKGNIDDHHRGVPIEDFPLTFRHALEVARYLGIRYIWIDSLCIIQDDEEDWRAESAKMGDIYEKAYATLFAERAANSDDGLVQTDEDLCVAEAKIPKFQFQHSGQDYEILLSTKLSTYPKSLEAAFCLVDHAPSHLQSRGWVVQEEILSRRKICFSSTELHWHCNQIIRCECGLIVHISEYDIQREGIMGNLAGRLLYEILPSDKVTKRLSTHGFRPSAFGFGKPWRKLVEAYTRRKLTFEEDRLMALAGIVSQVTKQRATSDSRYLSGIWLEHAISQLLWSSDFNEGTLPCHRQRCRYAPTFSWASATGSVAFYAGLRTAGMVASATIVSGGSELLVNNDAQPRDWIRIRGKALQVVAYGRKVRSHIESAQARWESSDYTYQSRVDGVYKVGFRVQSCDQVDEKVVTSLQLLRLDTPEDWEFFREKGKRRLLYLVVLCPMDQFGTGMAGLLLREVEGHDGHYERVCRVATSNAKCKWDRVRQYAVDTEIVLV
ncbi:hypothetical protein OQA88_8369 [Cercophora sp. LCS_1]